MLGRVPWGRLVPYSLSQLLGAYVASGLVYTVYYGESFWNFISYTHMQVLNVVVVLNYLCCCLRCNNGVQWRSVDCIWQK